MRFGLFYLPTYPSSEGPAPDWLLGEIVDQAVLAEQLGLESIWLGEHHFHGFGGVLSSPAGVGCAIAMRTRTLRIGTAVSLLPYHHPLRVAEDYATLDVLSEGRFDFGVGTGFLRWENEVFEAPLEIARAKFAEALDLILRVWRDENVAFDGQFTRFPALTVLPRPHQRPHPPVWLAATASPESFQLAGQRGYHLMLIPFLSDVAELRGKIALYHEALRAAGFDPASREVLAAYHVYVHPDRARCRAAAEVGVHHYLASAGEISQRTAQLPTPDSFRHVAQVSAATRTRDIDQLIAERRVVVGSAAECVDTLRRLQEELSLTYIAANTFLGGLERAETRRSMERLAADVVPHFRGAALPA